MELSSAAIAAKITTGVLLGAAALVAVTTVRLVLEGQHHLEEGEQLSRDGARTRAANEFEEAARAYVPGSPYPRRALNHLAMIAKGYEMRGETRQAASTWESIRRAVLSTRHLAQPNFDLLERAERQIRRLRARPRPDKISDAPDPAARPDDPSPLASILLFVGLASWIGGSVALIVAWRSPRAMRAVPLAACLGGLALWLVMCWLA